MNVCSVTRLNNGGWRFAKCIIRNQQLVKKQHVKEFCIYFTSPVLTSLTQHHLRCQLLTSQTQHHLRCQNRWNIQLSEAYLPCGRMRKTKKDIFLIPSSSSSSFCAVSIVDCKFFSSLNPTQSLRGEWVEYTFCSYSTLTSVSNLLLLFSMNLQFGLSEWLMKDATPASNVLCKWKM